MNADAAVQMDPEKDRMAAQYGRNACLELAQVSMAKIPGGFTG
jgi:hypothetical protein